MNFFEKTMRALFGTTKSLSDKYFSSKVCMGKLNQHLRVKIEFASSGTQGHYTGVVVTIINKNEGIVDRHFFLFSDAWGKKQISSNLTDPYIWDYNKVDWYGFKPTESDLKSFYKVVIDYINMFS